VRIVIVDVAQPLADLDLRDPSGGTYKAVWVLAMRGARPIGIATIPVSSETLRADDLERHLRESLGEAFDLNVSSTNSEVALPRASVIVATNVADRSSLRRRSSGSASWTTRNTRYSSSTIGHRAASTTKCWPQ